MASGDGNDSFALIIHSNPPLLLNDGERQSFHAVNSYVLTEENRVWSAAIMLRGLY